MKRIKAAIKRFIINAIVEDYKNNGRMRRLIADQHVEEANTSRKIATPQL